MGIKFLGVLVCALVMGCIGVATAQSPTKCADCILGNSGAWADGCTSISATFVVLNHGQCNYSTGNPNLCQPGGGCLVDVTAVVTEIPPCDHSFWVRTCAQIATQGEMCQADYVRGGTGTKHIPGIGITCGDSKGLEIARGPAGVPGDVLPGGEAGNVGVVRVTEIKATCGNPCPQLVLPVGGSNQ